MNCEEARPLIDAYMDGELEWDRKIAFETHLASCVGCQQALESRQHLSQAIKSAAVYVPAPPALAQLVRSRMIRRRKWRLGFVVGGLALAVIGFAGLYMHKTADTVGAANPDQLQAELAHVACEPRAIGFASTDPVAVQRWFRGKTDYLPMVPDLKRAGFSMVGARIGVLRGKSAPVLIYKNKTHIADIVQTLGCSGQQMHTTLTGLQVRSFEYCGVCYWVISDADPGSLDKLSDAVTGKVTPPRPAR